SAESGIEVISDLTKDRGDLLAVRATGVAPVTQVAADGVEELHEILDDDGHVIGLHAVALREAHGRVEHPHGERLKTLATVGDAELEAGARLERLGAGRKRRGVQEDVLAVICRDEAEPLLVVVEPDLAG